MSRGDPRQRFESYILQPTPLSAANQCVPVLRGNRVALPHLLRRVRRDTDVARESREAVAIDDFGEVIHGRYGYHKYPGERKTKCTHAAGYASSMQTDRAERLKWARERAGFTSPRDAAKRHRWNENTYKAREGGLRDYGVEEAKEYAKAFGVSWIWLVSGDGDSEAPTAVPVMGRIGAGATIEPDFDQVPPEGLYEVDLPFPMPGEMIGLEVDGESMLPKYEPGDVIVVWKGQRRDTTSFLGELAAVRTEDGRRYLKTIMRGAKRGLYRLESFNARPIEDVQVAWVGEINVIVPARQVRRISAHSKAVATRKHAAKERETTGMKRLV